MQTGLVGKKCGMTRIFTEDGESIPVTVLEIQPNKITQVKTLDTDGYAAVKVTTGSCKPSRVNKPTTSQYAKAGIEPGRGFWEFRLTNTGELKVGDELNVEQFKEGDKIKVTGISKGKGFAGCIKRHHFARQPETHGTSLTHRAPGSTGQNQTPGRVFKGKKMAGQLGNVQRTALNLTVVKVDVEKNLLLVKGAVPGWRGGDILVRPQTQAA